MPETQTRGVAKRQQISEGRLITKMGSSTKEPEAVPDGPFETEEPFQETFIP